MHHVVDDELLFRSLMDLLYAHARQPTPSAPAPADPPSGHPTPVALMDTVQEQVAILVAQRPGPVAELESPELLVAIKALVADLGDLDAPSDEDAAKLACLLYLGSELIEELTHVVQVKPD